MKTAFLIFLAIVLPLSAAPAVQPSAPTEIRRSASRDRRGVADSVTVPDGALLFTGQIPPIRIDGDARAQTASAFEALRDLLVNAGTDCAGIVRLTAYVPDAATAPLVDVWVAEHFARTPIAISFVRTPLTVPGAKLALEAIAALPKSSVTAANLNNLTAILPAGGKIFISGQAEKGTDLASAVRLTMAGLHRSLAHVGLKKSDVVQVKAFIRPFSEHETARREVAASFDGAAHPPLVLIEWQSELFAEIELIAAAPGLAAKPGETVAHSWLPWLTASPRYCNVAHVPAGVPLIFIRAIDGAPGDDRAQMKTIFERLGSVLFESGSSYRHLAKATYYLGGAPARALLGDIRGVYFDPTRPPAASALQMAAFAHPGRAAEIEMIAVPVK